jgi:copper transport protein
MMLVIVLLLASVMVVLQSKPVQAQQLHASLLRSEPVAGSVLASPPSAVCLWFSEIAQPVGQSIVVLSPTGTPIQDGALSIHGTQLCIPVKISTAGTYLVDWQVISQDTHPSSGAFIFSVRRASGPWANSGQSAADISPLGLCLQVAGRLLHMLGYALSFGPFAFYWLVLSFLPSTDKERIQHRLERLVTPGILALVLAEGLALLAQAASMSSAALLNVSLLGDIMATSFGRVLAQRLGAALLLWILVGTIQYNARRAQVAIVGLGLVLAGIDGEASHALNGNPIWLSLLANAVHIAAMGMWVGGLITLLAIWRLPEVASWRSLLLLRFGQMATVAVTELILSGVIMAGMNLAQPLDLLTTAYGRVLLCKVIVLLLVLLLAFIGQRRRPALQHAWWVRETLGLLGLLLLAALLVSLPSASLSR